MATTRVMLLKPENQTFYRGHGVYTLSIDATLVSWFEAEGRLSGDQAAIDVAIADGLANIQLTQDQTDAYLLGIPVTKSGYASLSDPRLKTPAEFGIGPLFINSVRYWGDGVTLTPVAGSTAPNNTVVANPAATIQTAFSSITDASADNGYVLTVPPGRYDESVDLVLNNASIDIIGEGRRKARVYLNASQSVGYTFIGDLGTKFSNLEIFAGWMNNTNHIVIGNSNDVELHNLSLRYGNGDGALVFDHSTNYVSKYVWITNIKISVNTVGILNRDLLGYARLHIDKGNIQTNATIANSHGIYGNIVGSIKSVRFSVCGGNHIRLENSVRGILIESCHMEQTASGINIYLKNCVGVVIRGNTITAGNSIYPVSANIYLENCFGCEISNNTIEHADATSQAVYASITVDALSKGNKILNNNFAGTITGTKEHYNVSPGNTIEEAAPEDIVSGVATLAHWGSSNLDSTAGAITGTLPDGLMIGQRKTIVMTNATNSSTITATNHETSNPEIAAFNAVNQYWLLEWSGTKWITIKATCAFL